MIELKRTELLASLDEMSRSGSLLVVGKAGAGKSWLLRQFAEKREAAGDAVLLLSAEEHSYVNSLSQLEESLGIPGLIPTLKGYCGVQKLLILDSLDALRAEASQRVFRHLIRQVRRKLPEWKIIASVRSLDTHESLELHTLFAPSGTSLAGVRARHLVVPVFDDSELGHAKKQDARLAPILASASPALLGILRNAFNLCLLVHLLDERAVLDWLYKIESEVQLYRTVLELSAFKVLRHL
jgi:hypothetical protein